MAESDWTPWDMSGMTVAEESRIRSWAKARQVEVEQAKIARNKAEGRAAELQAQLDAIAASTPCTSPAVHAELAIRCQRAEAAAQVATGRLSVLERALAAVQGAVLNIEVPRG